MSVGKIHGEIVIASGTNNQLRVQGTGAPTFAATTVTLTAANYFPIALASHIQTQLQAVDATFTCTVSDTTGKFTIARTGAFSLLWSTGGVNNCGAEIGFDESADDTGAATYTSDYQHTKGWYPALDAEFDSREGDEYEESRTQAISGKVVIRHWAVTPREPRTLRFSYLTAAKTFVDDESTTVNEAIQRLFQSAAWKARLRWFPDRTVNGTNTDYTLQNGDPFMPQRTHPKPALFTVELKLLKYVS